MSQDPFDYAVLLQDALRQLVRRSLELVAEQGFCGEHHFYLSFDTQAPGVILPHNLQEQYPEEMTIVLKTQFRDLLIDDDSFSVVLFFGGVPHQLTIPFAALRSFADPSASFQLVFPAVDDEEDVRADDVGDEDARADEGAAPEGELAVMPVADETEAEPATDAGPAKDNVVSIAGFRKKG
ncbi:MAG: ClpXP protease specificity-enhancing factor SspB [Acidobacteriota bacterium]